MRESFRLRLRPEEILFLGLLALVVAIHEVLREPFFVFWWLDRTWKVNDAFRWSVSLGAIAVALTFVALALVGRKGREYLGSGLAALRDFLPFGFMYIVYESVHALGPKLHGRVYDDLLVAADRVLFGTQVFIDVPSAISHSIHARLLTYYLAFCYSAVFIVYWGMAIYFFFCFRRLIFRRYMLSVVLTSYLGYLGYLILPALGPYEALTRPGLIDLEMWSHQDGAQAITLFADSIRDFHLDKIPACDAFPSLHTAWSIIVLGFAWRYARWLLVVLVPWAFGTVVGALYLQQHYLIDIVAGLPTAMAGVFLATLMLGGANVKVAMSSQPNQPVLPSPWRRFVTWLLPHTCRPEGDVLRSNLMWEFARWSALEYFWAFHGVRYRGVSHIPTKGPIIIAPNHISYYDPPLVAAGIPFRVRFMAWEPLFRVPGFRQLIEMYGAYPVRGNGADKAAVERTLRLLRNRECVMIFPEGQRSETGELLEFAPGVARLAIQTGATIVPVTISGAYEAWPRQRTLPTWFRTMTVKFHRPVSVPDSPDRRQIKEVTACVNDEVRKPINRRLRAYERLMARRRKPSA